jgi:hypothetical protein
MWRKSVFASRYTEFNGTSMIISETPRDFGQKYASAWSSQQPEKVARMFSADGSLTINSGVPAIGRASVATIARGFMISFPDLDVRCDRLIYENGELRWYWTMKGTNSGPGGSGKSIDISGFEAIELNSDGLIVSAQGFYDEAEYNRQLVPDNPELD